MKQKNSNLDELQERQLLEAEHNGYWIGFWGLLAAILIQSLVFSNADFRLLAGEWIVFMVMAVYLAAACIRRGIWDRRIPMNTRTNLALSAVTALLFGAFSAIVIFRNYQMPAGTLAAACIAAAFTFILCFAALTIAMKATEKRQKKLEEEPADADKM